MDTQLLLLINQDLANGFFDVLMPALSQRGYLLVLPFILLMVLEAADRRNDAGRSFLPLAVWTVLVATAALFLSEWTAYVLKTAIARERPCRALDGIRLVIACPRSYSMPSGHAITSFACAAPLFYLPRGFLSTAWRSFPLMLAAVIAFSRLYLGVHYPCDAVVGALLGSLIGFALSLLYRVIDPQERGVQRR